MDEYRYVDIDEIAPGPFQPRKRFSASAIESLAESIKATKEAIQPVVIQPSPGQRSGARFEIVAGERRWRAYQRLRRAKVPCRVLEGLDDVTAARYALLENVDREDLTPVEVGEALERLQKEFGYSQSSLAKELGKSRTEICRLIGLRRLAPETQSALAEDQIKVGHAKALAGLKRDEQRKLTKRCIDEQWSVRQLEEEVRVTRCNAQPGNPPRTPDIDSLAQALGEHLGAVVRMEAVGKGGWRMRVSSHAPLVLAGQLERLAQLLEGSHGREAPASLEIEGPSEVFDFLSEFNR